MEALVARGGGVAWLGRGRPRVCTRGLWEVSAAGDLAVGPMGMVDTVPIVACPASFPGCSRDPQSAGPSRGLGWILAGARGAGGLACGRRALGSAPRVSLAVASAVPAGAGMSSVGGGGRNRTPGRRGHDRRRPMFVLVGAVEGPPRRGTSSSCGWWPGPVVVVPRWPVFRNPRTEACPPGGGWHCVSRRRIPALCACCGRPRRQRDFLRGPVSLIAVLPPGLRRSVTSIVRSEPEILHTPKFPDPRASSWC